MSLCLCEKFLLCLLAYLFLAAPAYAQTSPEDQMYTIAKKLNCPTCAGRNLADCPTDTCTQWKNEIIDQLKQGKSSEEIVDYFQARFGSTVLQEPPKEGFTLLMWLIPVVAFAALGAVAIVVVQRSSRRTAAAPSTPTASNDPYTDELERQIKDGA